MPDKAKRDWNQWFEDVRAAARDAVSSIQTPSLGELATLILAAATLVVAMGATVVWIRAGQAELPQEETLSLVARETFVIVGAKELVLPVLFFTALSALAFVLGTADARRSARSGTQSRRQRARGGAPEVLRGLAIGIFLFWSFTWSTGALVASLLVWSLVIRYELFGARIGPILMIGAAVASGSALANEADAGVRFSTAKIERSGGIIRGLYVSSKDQTVVLGVDGDLLQIPMREIEAVSVGDPPADDDEPSPSVFDRLVDAVGDVL